MKLCFKNMDKKDLDKDAKLFQVAFQQAPWNENWTYQQSFERLSEIMSTHSSIGYVIYDNESNSLCTKSEPDMNHLTNIVLKHIQHLIIQ